jgi:hypothetical protein
VTAKQYAENLEANLWDLHERLCDNRYVAPPVERVGSAAGRCHLADDIESIPASGLRRMVCQGRPIPNEGPLLFDAFCGNFKMLEVVFEYTERAWRYWLSRRSHKGHIHWQKFVDALSCLESLLKYA